MKKRFLSILLTVCMILSLMPAVFAAETEVAQVGATKYDTLQAAINAASEGDTVVVLKNIDLTETLIVDSDDNIILDLNGKIVSMVYTDLITANHTLLKNKGTLTIMDSSNPSTGKLSYKYDGPTAAWQAATTISNTSGTLTIKSGTIESLSLSTNSLDVNTNVYKFTIDNLTNGNSGDAILNIEGGVITAAKGGSIRGFANSSANECIINITGGEITGQVWMQDPNSSSADKGTMNITGGTINPNNPSVDAIYMDGYGDASGMTANIGGDVVVNGSIYLYSQGATDTINASITGGTFNGSVSIYEWDNSFSSANPIPSIHGGTFTEAPDEELLGEGVALETGVDENGNPVYGTIITDPELTVFKAAIGNKGYATLAEAINAASEGDTVAVLKDIALTEGITVPAGKTITLDLNGKTVSMTDSSGAAAALITNLGTLTINDSVGGGKLTFVTTTPGGQSYASNTISNRGVLIINDGTIENTSDGPACYALDCYAGSTATINGGKLTALRTAVRIFNWSATPAKLNITGGEIVAGSGYAININMGNTPSVELNISGGTITTTSNSYNLAVYAYMTDNSSYSAENVKINITGGAFNGNVALNGKTSASFTEGNISVSGGTMDGVICYDTPAHGFISGGTFKAAPADDNLVEGYALEESTDENGDPVYGIIIDPEQTVFAAAVNGVGYETLEEAIAAVENGGTIQLLNDATLTSQIKITGKSFNIEGNGNKITGTGALWLLSGTYNINNVVFENINYTATYGILEFTYATANITNCTFTGNVSQSCIAVDTNADNDGNSNVTIEGCTFVNNNCSTCLIHSAEGTTTVENSKITGNTSGIAVIYNSANLNVNGNVFEDNTLTGDNANQAVILSGPWVEGSYELNVNENVFLDDILGVYVESFVDDVANDLNDNYWNGGEPSVTVEDGADVALDSYYLEYSVDADGNITFDTVVLVSETGDSLYPVTFRTEYDSIFEVKTADGKVIAPIDGAYYLANGEYTVTASAFGYWPKTVRFYVTGAPKTVTIFLDPVIIAPVIKPEIPEKPEVIDPVVKNPFTDVSKNDYFYDAVLWAIENEITSGTTATTFSPSAVCTRAHAVTFLWNAAGKPEPTSTSLTFTDVSADAYYYKAVLWAVENGIIYGTSETTFAPDAECTRSQIVTMLWRNAGCPVSKVTTDNFNDVAENNYYYLAVLWAVENEITIGTTTTTFSPDADCTRGQIVTFMYRELADK